MKKLLVALPVLALMLVFSGCAHTAPEKINEPAPENTAQAPVEKELQEETTRPADGTVPINKEKSEVTWFGKKVTGGEHNGTVQLKSGAVDLPGGVLTGGVFVMDMTTIEDVDGNERLEGHLKSEDFFAVDSYPEATLEITSVEPAEDGTTYSITADLTIKGQTHEVTFPATITEEDGVYTGTAELSLDRTRWGVNYGSGSVFKDLVDNVIEDTMVIGVNIVTE